MLHIITTSNWVQISNMKLIPDLNILNEKFDRNVLFAVMRNKLLKNIKVEIRFYYESYLCVRNLYGS